MINTAKSHKKYFSLFFTLAFILLSAQKKFTVVLDAGHGGERDPGASRYYSDIGRLNEKDVTLAIVLKLGRMLEKNKDYKVIYTRKEDVYPTLSERTDLANRSKADLFISVHCNSSPKAVSTAYGTETFVQGPDQNRTNLEVAKRENDVIFLDEKDREKFASYNPSDPESLIALKIQQSKYLQASLAFGSMVEENFANKDKRLSRGVMQKDLHVLRMNAMPSVLIETGFINHPEDGHYLASDKGQQEIAESIYEAIVRYRKIVSGKSTAISEPQKPAETPLKNDFRVLLMSTPTRYNAGDPALKGLNNILILKESGQYKYYYAKTNMASLRDANLKSAKDAGFQNAVSVGFMPNQNLGSGYYRIELAATNDKLSSNSYMLQTLKDVDRRKENGRFYYTYGNVKSLEDAIQLQKDLDAKGIKNTVIEKVAH